MTMLTSVRSRPISTFITRLRMPSVSTLSSPAANCRRPRRRIVVNRISAFFSIGKNVFDKQTHHPVVIERPRVANDRERMPLARLGDDGADFGLGVLVAPHQ